MIWLCSNNHLHWWYVDH